MACGIKTGGRRSSVPESAWVKALKVTGLGGGIFTGIIFLTSCFRATVGGGGNGAAGLAGGGGVGRGAGTGN